MEMCRGWASAPGCDLSLMLVIVCGDPKPSALRVDQYRPELLGSCATGQSSYIR